MSTTATLTWLHPDQRTAQEALSRCEDWIAGDGSPQEIEHHDQLRLARHHANPSARWFPLFIRVHADHLLDLSGFPALEWPYYYLPPMPGVRPLRTQLLIVPAQVHDVAAVTTRPPLCALDTTAHRGWAALPTDHQIRETLASAWGMHATSPTRAWHACPEPAPATPEKTAMVRSILRLHPSQGGDVSEDLQRVTGPTSRWDVAEPLLRAYAFAIDTALMP